MFRNYLLPVKDKEYYFMLGESESSYSPSKMLTVEEVAYVLSLHPSTIRRWRQRGRLKSYLISNEGCVRFKISDVVRIMKFRRRHLLSGTA